MAIRVRDVPFKYLDQVNKKAQFKQKDKTVLYNSDNTNLHHKRKFLKKTNEVVANVDFERTFPDNISPSRTEVINSLREMRREIIEWNDKVETKKLYIIREKIYNLFGSTLKVQSTHIDEVLYAFFPDIETNVRFQNTDAAIKELKQEIIRDELKPHKELCKGVYVSKILKKGKHEYCLTYEKVEGQDYFLLKLFTRKKDSSWEEIKYAKKEGKKYSYEFKEDDDKHAYLASHAENEKPIRVKRGSDLSKAIKILQRTVPGIIDLEKDVRFQDDPANVKDLNLLRSMILEWDLGPYTEEYPGYYLSKVLIDPTSSRMICLAYHKEEGEDTYLLHLYSYEDNEWEEIQACTYKEESENPQIDSQLLPEEWNPYLNEHANKNYVLVGEPTAEEMDKLFKIFEFNVPAQKEVI